MSLTHDALQQSAAEHLMLHFSKQHMDDLLVLERGEGPYVFDTTGNRYIDALSSLFCSQIGYSYGEEMAAAAAAQLTTLAFNTNWATAHPAAIELAERLADLAPSGMTRVLFTERRLGVGRGGVEDRARALPRDRPAAAHEGDRARHRLPRRHAGRAVVHGRRAVQGRRSARRRSTSRRSRTPTRSARRTATTRPPSARGCWPRSRTRSSPRARTRSR